MSQLNLDMPGFGHTGVRVRDGNPLRKPNLDLRALTRAVLSILNPKEGVLIVEQNERIVAESFSTACPQDEKQNCCIQMNTAEYQHLVDLGRWHHRRQRRRARLRR